MLIRGRPRLGESEEVNVFEGMDLPEKVVTEESPRPRRRRRRTEERLTGGKITENGELIVSEGEIIEDGAYEGRLELVSVKLPETLLYIGKRAFCGCENLKEIVFPSGLKLIGESAFCGCRSLTKIVIPGSVERVDRFAFYDCTGLEELKIENGVRQLGRLAFGRCKSLKNFHAWKLPRSVPRVIEVGRDRKDPVMQCVFAGSPCAETREEKRSKKIAKKFQSATFL